MGIYLMVIAQDVTERFDALVCIPVNCQQRLSNDWPSKRDFLPSELSSVLSADFVIIFS